MTTTTARHNNNIVDRYWHTLRSMSKSDRLSLVVKLTNSILEDEKKEEKGTDDDYTEKMLDRFYGKWAGNETADEIMKTIKEFSTSREPLKF